MRSKIIALGLSAATAATFAFTVAAPAAHANVLTDVCNALPNIVTSINASTSKAGIDAGVAASNLSLKSTALTNAIQPYINAVVAQLQQVAAGLDTSVTTATLNARVADLSKAFSEWAVANAANFTAQQALFVAQMQSQIVTGLTSGACV